MTLNQLFKNDNVKAFLLGMLLLIIALWLSSCEAYRKKICASCPTNSKDSIVTVEHTEVKFDTLWLPPKATDPIYLPNPCANLCDSMGHLKKFDVVKHYRGLTSEVKSVGDVIVATCKEDSLKQVNEVLTKTVKTYEKKVIEKQVVKNELTQWQQFFITMGEILSVLIVIYILIRVLQRFPVFKFLKFIP